jgi:hypothetical protein
MTLSISRWKICSPTINDADPRSVGIAGGSVAGGMDHLVAALVMRAAGE